MQPLQFIWHIWLERGADIFNETLVSVEVVVDLDCVYAPLWCSLIGFFSRDVLIKYVKQLEDDVNFMILLF